MFRYGQYLEVELYYILLTFEEASCVFCLKDEDVFPRLLVESGEELNTVDVVDTDAVSLCVPSGCVLALRAEADHFTERLAIDNYV